MVIEQSFLKLAQQQMLKGEDMNKPKVFVVGNDFGVSGMFNQQGWEIVRNVVDADLVQFTGGADVSPELYGEENISSYTNIKRDQLEKNLYDQILELGKPMAGICRGGQFLNVMAGGKMYQHVERHAIGGTHKLMDLETKTMIDVTSTHHQMMIEAEDAEVVAVANEGGYKLKEGKSKDTIFPEHDTEVLYYERGICPILCFQPHPEYNVKSCKDYYFSLLNRYMGL